MICLNIAYIPNTGTNQQLLLWSLWTSPNMTTIYLNDCNKYFEILRPNLPSQTINTFYVDTIILIQQQGSIRLLWQVRFKRFISNCIKIWFLIDPNTVLPSSTHFNYGSVNGFILCNEMSYYKDDRLTEKLCPR